MPSKYVVHTEPVPHRFEAITKSGVIAWEEGCLKCAVCVKKRCIYGVYEKRGLDTRQMIDSIDNQCMNCFRCVQSCPKELIHKSVNPEFKALGDFHWTPDIIARLWYQAETGKIPVSGAGYPGPFSGPGFDSMWTDMSEIVRPTRDGIHGREYISAAVDIGRTPSHLIFADDGTVGGAPELIDIPLPMILRMPSFGSLSRNTIKGWAMGARKLNTFLALPDDMIAEDLDAYRSNLIPVITSEKRKEKPNFDGIRLSELAYEDYGEKQISAAKSDSSDSLIIVRLPLVEGVEGKVLSIAKSGAAIIHLAGTSGGRAMDNDQLFIKDAIRSVHLKLVDAGVRDEVTLIASGGFAMAEHVAKSIICGVDAVFVDFPALIALECRMCRRCIRGLSCPVEIEEADPEWVSSRVINLIGAWHNQLLEVMGAMGIRDARRIRGEAGRAIFFEDLDEATFGFLGDNEGKYDGNYEEGWELE